MLALGVVGVGKPNVLKVYGIDGALRSRPSIPDYGADIVANTSILASMTREVGVAY